MSGIVRTAFICVATLVLSAAETQAQSSDGPCISRSQQGGWTIEVGPRRGVDALGGDEIGYVRPQRGVSSLGGDEIGYVRASLSRPIAGGGEVRFVRLVPVQGSGGSDWRLYVVGDGAGGSNARYAVTSASGRREIVSQEPQGLAFSQDMRRELFRGSMTLQPGLASQMDEFVADRARAPIRIDGLSGAVRAAEEAQARSLDAARAGRCAG
ncbi:MAG: hypothetical protein K2X07_00430 [Caulobacteraceae bacterium]|nr:hypothetical protein [Caulobacteraceae bacterium]